VEAIIKNQSFNLQYLRKERFEVKRKPTQNSNVKYPNLKKYAAAKLLSVLLYYCSYNDILYFVAN